MVASGADSRSQNGARGTANFLRFGSMSSNTASDTANARVRVIVRVRPLRPKEVAQGVKEIVKAPENHENDQTLSIRDPASLLAGVRSELVESWSPDFTFDKCLFSNDPNSFRYARQEHLFDEVGLPVLDWCFLGSTAACSHLGRRAVARLIA